jgi:hypothetical protein
VTSIKKLDCCVRNVAAKSLRARGNEIGVVFSPDGEQRRFPLPEIFVERWVELYVVGIVEEEIQLNVYVAGARQQCCIEGVALGAMTSGLGMPEEYSRFIPSRFRALRIALRFSAVGWLQ